MVYILVIIILLTSWYGWQIFFTKNIPIFKNLIEWNDEKKHKLEQLFFYFLYLLYHSFPILIYTYRDSFLVPEKVPHPKSVTSSAYEGMYVNSYDTEEVALIIGIILLLVSIMIAVHGFIYNLYDDPLYTWDSKKEWIGDRLILCHSKFYSLFFNFILTIIIWLLFDYVLS